MTEAEQNVRKFFSEIYPNLYSPEQTVGWMMFMTRQMSVTSFRTPEEAYAVVAFRCEVIAETGEG